MAKSCVLCLIAILLFAADGFSQSRRSPSSPDDKIVISGVRVNNFYKKNEANYGDSILLLIGDNTITYFRNENTFRISVMAITPAEFRKNRDIVERQFLRLLGVTRVDACKLQVKETANSPGGWDGKTYGLSFCPMQASIKPRSGTQSHDWDSFWNAFSTAVNKKDRVAIKRLMSSESDFLTHGGIGSRNDYLQMFNDKSYWRDVQRSVARGTMSFDLERGRPARITRDRYLIFELISGRWRFVGVMGD